MKSSSLNGAPKMVRTASGKLEVEDGEIEDAKMTENPTIDGKSSSSLQQPQPASLEISKTLENSASPAETSTRPDILRKDSPAPGATQNLQPSATNPPPITRPENRSTVPSTQLPVPSRPDFSRSASANTVSGPFQHGLPNKPEANASRGGDQRMPPRTEGRGLHDNSRESRFSERTGADRSRDIIRDRGPERSTSGSYPQSHERTSDRISERGPIVDRERMDQRHGSDRPPLERVVDDRHNGLHIRDARQLPRDDRVDRPLNDRLFAEQPYNRRDADTPTQSIRDTAMPPPRSNIPQHPDRAALIQGNQIASRGIPANNTPERRSEPPRHENYSHPGRNSRGASPKRDEDRRLSRDDNLREERTPMDMRRAGDEPPRLNQPRYEESHAPTGPRTGRPSGALLTNPNDRFRDSMKTSTLPSAAESSHGRLSQDSAHSGRQAESQYGRLNSSTDIPSGPRLANGNHPPPTRGGRNVSAPQPHLNTQQLLNASQGPATAAPAQDRQTPSGPSMRGSPRRPSTFTPLNPASSAPPTPVAQSPETAGIHPDRLKAIQGSEAAVAEDAPANRGPRQAPPPMAIPNPGPPRGPNSHLPSPLSQSPTNRGPPTGPSFPNDRNRDKRFAGLQTVLQQAGTPAVPERSSQGASIRGRGGRANHVSISSPIIPGPPPPNLPRQDGPAPRGDLFAGRPNGLANPPQSEADMAYERGGRRGAPRDDGDRRSVRHRSRSPKERALAASVRLREDDAVYGRDGAGERSRPSEAQTERDLRVGGGQSDRSIRGGAVLERRDFRADEASRDTRRSGREEGQYRDRRMDLDQRDGGDRRDGRDRRDGGVNGRKRGRGGDEGPGDRGFAENKRLRR